MTLDATPDSASQPPEAATSSRPLRAAQEPVPKFYGFKRWFWSKMIRQVISTSAPLPLLAPHDEDLAKLRLITYGEFSQGQAPLNHVVVTQDVPAQERSLAKVWLLEVVRILATPLCLQHRNLPRIRAGVKTSELDIAGATNLAACYPKSWDELKVHLWPGAEAVARPLPAAQASFRAHPEDIIGAIALEGPFAGYISAMPDVMPEEPGRYVIDLTSLEKYPPKSGFEPLGGRAILTWSPEAQRMFTVSLQTPDGQVINKPASGALTDTEWRRAQDVFLASLSTHMTAVEHLVHCHLKGTGEPAAAAVHTLPAAHPLRRWLHPFVHETLSTNNFKVKTLIAGPTAILPKLYALERETLHRMLDDAAAAFDIAIFDPRAEAERRGMHDFAGPYLYRDDSIALWDIFVDYAAKTLDHIYATDADLQGDEAVAAWLGCWSEMNPSVADCLPERTKTGLARLLANVVFAATVAHENVGNVTWNYTTLHEYIPSRVPLDAARDTIDVQQEYMNLTLATFIPQALLMDPDLIDFAPDAESRRLAEAFLASLTAQHEAMKVEDGDAFPLPYRLYPELLERAVNA